MSATSSTGTFVVFIFICVFALSIGKYTPVKIDVKAEINGKLMKEFTKDDIAKYDASDPDLPIYLGMRGVVFDVTSGKKFYSKESEYNKLVGKDASRGHALWSLEDKDLSHDLSDLSDSQLESLDMIFTETYMAKYPVVGYMDFLIAEQPEDVVRKFKKDEL